MHGDVRERRTTCWPSGPVDAARRVLRRAVRPGGRRRQPGSTGWSGRISSAPTHCLELCRRHDAQLVFLSTSRVYPVRPAANAAVERGADPFRARRRSQPCREPAGWASRRIFPLDGAPDALRRDEARSRAPHRRSTVRRSAFGPSSIAAASSQARGRWARSTRASCAYWMLAHMFRRPLTYIGFGGSGKQVRDLLHVDDLIGLVELQLSRARAPGPASSRTSAAARRAPPVAPRDSRSCAREITGNVVEVSATPEDRPGDIPWYVTDCTRLNGLTSWRPSSTLRGILADVYDWIRENEAELGQALAIDGAR